LQWRTFSNSVHRNCWPALSANSEKGRARAALPLQEKTKPDFSGRNSLDTAPMMGQFCGVMTELAAEQPISVRQIGRVRVEELPDGFSIVVPRTFPWQLYPVAVVFSLIFAVLPANKSMGFWGALAFYGIFAVLVTLLRLTQHHVIRVTAGEIMVRHENFGLCWFKKQYSILPACSIRWAPARRKMPSALELSCGGRTARFGYDITQEEAGSLLQLVQQRFPHIREQA
jgi:hypothetical protein